MFKSLERITSPLNSLWSDGSPDPSRPRQQLLAGPSTWLAAWAVVGPNWLWDKPRFPAQDWTKLAEVLANVHLVKALIIFFTLNFGYFRNYMISKHDRNLKVTRKAPFRSPLYLLSNWGDARLPSWPWGIHVSLSAEMDFEMNVKVCLGCGDETGVYMENPSSFFPSGGKSD